jgi:poly-beta-1,6-N-acetyl-D-glucosamine synthase
MPSPGPLFWQMERLLVVTPVHNEASHLELVARSMAAQERAPDLWMIVDDDSEDETPELARRLAGEIPFARTLILPPRPASSGRDRLAEAAAPRAFNAGLRAAGAGSFTHLAKLDGDVELPPEYYDELLRRMRRDPELGIACGDLVEPDGDGWRRLPIPPHHVHGALKLYTRACFEEIGGVREILGWDTVDETYARMRGWRTRSFSDVVARHHRPSASAQGLLRGRARHGACAYVAHFSLPWVALRSLKVALKPPLGLSGAAFLYGYLRAAALSTEQVEDPEFRRFVRRELRGRMLGPLRMRSA